MLDGVLCINSVSYSGIQVVAPLVALVPNVVLGTALRRTRRNGYAIESVADRDYINEASMSSMCWSITSSVSSESRIWSRSARPNEVSSTLVSQMFSKSRRNRQ